MNEAAIENQVYLGAYKASIELVCESVNLLARTTGFPQESADAAILELAKQIKMKPEGRAAKYLDNFLFGNGAEISFDASVLFAEDPGVRNRVRSVVYDKLMQNPDLKTGVKNASGGDHLVWVRQSDFTTRDWHYALGSFPFEWEVVGQRCIDPIYRESREVLVKVWGANEYKWHPLANRVTQCIHEAGDRLQKSSLWKEASNFWMIAKPCVLVVQTGRILPV